jgi:uncharacterized protein HemX
VNEPLDELKTRLSLIEQRNEFLDNIKATKSDLTDLKAAKADRSALDDLDKRTGGLESKFAIAVAIAIVFGLGGAGIGGLLLRAQNSIQDLSKQSQDLEARFKSMLPTIDAAKNKAVSEVDDAGKTIQSAIEKNIAERLKIETHQFCTGEYDGPCAPVPRYDPRDYSINKIAGTL